MHGLLCCPQGRPEAGELWLWPESGWPAQLPYMKSAELAPGLSCTFPAVNLRARFPKPKLGHGLAQRTLSMAECVYLNVLIEE